MAPSWQQLLIILIIVALIFGTKKLRSMGSDLGGAVKGFKKSMSDSDSDTNDNKLEEHSDTTADSPTNTDSNVNNDK